MSLVILHSPPSILVQTSQHGHSYIMYNYNIGGHGCSLVVDSMLSVQGVQFLHFLKIHNLPKTMSIARDNILNTLFQGSPEMLTQPLWMLGAKLWSSARAVCTLCS